MTLAHDTKVDKYDCGVQSSTFVRRTNIIDHTEGVDETRISSILISYRRVVGETGGAGRKQQVLFSNTRGRANGSSVDTWQCYHR